MPKATTNISAAKHYSLGVDAYVQATSPLRRYSDLLVHRQLLTSKYNKNTYSEVDLVSFIDQNNIRSKEIYELIRQDRRYSIAKWFARSNSNIYETIFIRLLNSRDFVFLFHFIDLSMDIAIVVKDLRQISFGKYLSLQLYKVDLDSLVVYFEVNKYH